MDKKILVIGCGVMGSALAKHFAQKNKLFLFDRNVEKCQALAQKCQGNVVVDLKIGIKEVDLILFAVKPKNLNDLSDEIGEEFKSNQIILSILTGITLQSLKDRFSHAKIVRMMANLPLLCNEGVIALAEDSLLDEQTKKQCETILKGLGLITWLDEDLFNPFTALSGSGPAFIYVIIEAMIEAGIKLGFDKIAASEFTLQTIAGSIALMKQTNKLPEELKWEIASPSGTTIYGIQKLEETGVRAGIMQCIQEACRRADEHGED